MSMVVKRVTIPLPGWASPDARMSVLLVSADADFRAVARRVLRDANYEAETAAHGGHALLACMERRFDVILIDGPSLQEGDTFVGGLLKRATESRVFRLARRPDTAEGLIALVATLTPRAGTASRPAER